MDNDNPMRLLAEAKDKARALGDESSKYCTLATVESKDASQPRMRTLVVRDLDEKSCVLFVNNSSQKNLHSIERTKAEILFFYPSLMTQFRVRGELSLLEPDLLESHWHHKPYLAKLLDHFYDDQPQSSTLRRREALDQKIDALKQRFPRADSVPFPAGAEGLRVTANYVEIWVGREDGLHNRRLFRHDNGKWHYSELVP